MFFSPIYLFSIVLKDAICKLSNTKNINVVDYQFQDGIHEKKMPFQEDFEICCFKILNLRLKKTLFILQNKYINYVSC